MAPLRPLTALLLAASLLTGCVMFEQAPAPLACDPDLVGRWIPLPDSPQDRVPLGKDDVRGSRCTLPRPPPRQQPP
ncbi:MAG: hypothetical protein QM795_05955 [Pseudoxanthomonas sp.]